MHIFTILQILAFLITGPNRLQAEPPDQFKSKADSLAQMIIIADGHIDLPYKMRAYEEGWEAYLQLLDQNMPFDEFDLPRAVAGGLNAPFMSIYIPPTYQETGGAKALADSLIESVESIVNTYPENFALAANPHDVEANFKAKKISLPLGMENGAGIEGDLENLQYFFDRGIRYITLTHGKDNRIGDSSYDTTRTWNGLSPFGRTVVEEMNRLGIMVDVSHVTDETLFDVLAVSKAPVIASHSSCRYFTPGWERNLPDKGIRAIAENGGIVMINFGSNFLQASSMKAELEIKAALADSGADINRKNINAYIAANYDEHPIYASVGAVADHIDYVKNLVGIEHIGLGSDFDGLGDTLPVGLKDVSDYPNLLAELLRRGYTEAEIKKICWENLKRVWQEVLDGAEVEVVER